jgi:hypothetical protein
LSNINIPLLIGLDQCRLNPATAKKNELFRGFLSDPRIWRAPSPLRAFPDMEVRFYSFAGYPAMRILIFTKHMKLSASPLAAPPSPL